MTPNSALTTRIQRFLSVGVIATIVHWLCVVLLVDVFGLAPLVANIFAFSVAFVVSYQGHKHWTFSQRNSSPYRFFYVAIFGFLINEMSYAILLYVLHIEYRIGLLISFGVAAVSTYLLSNYWAFRGKHHE